MIEGYLRFQPMGQRERLDFHQPERASFQSENESDISSAQNGHERNIFKESQNFRN